MTSIGERVKRSWNAFMGRDPTYYGGIRYGPSTMYKPDRVRLSTDNIRSIMNTIFNRIAVDCSQVSILHVRLDEVQGHYKETIKSTLNECLTLNANIDQTGRALIQDAVMSMFDEGCVAIVPTDTIGDPRLTESYQIESLRVGQIKEWAPYEVKLNVYNEAIGRKQDLVMRKKDVAIIENPFYTIMNERNSTAQRLIRVLNQIDRTNEHNSSGKMDLIIQFPYSLKSPSKRELAEIRRKDLEEQLTGSQLGVGYIDATERVTQLNRSIENNLWTQAKDLTNQLFNQLGLTESIFNGTADEKTKLDYYNRTIEPIMSAISLEMERKWLSKTARSQAQAIRFFRDPFKLVPVNDLAEIADKFTRNEIMSSNEIRAVVGMAPSSEPKADQLTNSNLYQTKDRVIERPEEETTEDQDVSEERTTEEKKVVRNVSTNFQNE